MTATATSPRWLGNCHPKPYGCGREDVHIESRVAHGMRALCDECAGQPPVRSTAVALDSPRLAVVPEECAAVDRTGGSRTASYAITWTDTKPPRLVLPPKPAVDDPAGLCAWLTATFNLNPAHPITSGHHEGLRGVAGHVVLKRRNAPPIRFEPASRINTPARLIEDLSWQTLPTDGAIHALKGEHCREIAHVCRMLCGATKAISDEEETAGLVIAFLGAALEREGFTTYGTPEQRYEAAAALQRDVDEMTGRPVGAPRYFIDASTGEYVIRVQDLAESVRRQLGSGLARGFLDARLDGIGWTRARLDGHALPGRAGRSGPHARCQVYRGLLAGPDNEGSVTT